MTHPAAPEDDEEDDRHQIFATEAGKAWVI
jgi:hypothetical protein